jgi:hypothetical protein
MLPPDVSGAGALPPGVTGVSYWDAANLPLAQGGKPDYSGMTGVEAFLEYQRRVKARDYGTSERAGGKRVTIGGGSVWRQTWENMSQEEKNKFLQERGLDPNQIRQIEENVRQTGAQWSQDNPPMAPGTDTTQSLIPGIPAHRRPPRPQIPAVLPTAANVSNFGQQIIDDINRVNLDPALAASISEAIQAAIHNAVTSAAGEFGGTMANLGQRPGSEGRVEVTGATDLNLNFIVEAGDLGRIPDHIREKLEIQIANLKESIRIMVANSPKMQGLGIEGEIPMSRHQALRESGELLPP